MKPTRKTWLLLAVLAVLLLANLVDRAAPEGGEQLPALAALQPGEITRIELSNSIDKVVIEPTADPTASSEGLESDALESGAVETGAVETGAERRWRMLAPVEAPADQLMLRSLLTVFDEAVPMDVRVDQGELEAYGLTPGNGIIVELWSGGDDPVVSLTVGADAPGGSNFVRLSGSEAIYRARMGGRDRYSPKGSLWRNRVPLDFEREDVVEVTVDRVGAERVVLARGPSASEDQPGTWALEPAAAWAVDHDAIEATLSRLGGARADEVLADDFDAGFDPPLLTATFELMDGSSHVLHVGSRGHPEAVFARVEGDAAVYRLPRRDVLGLARSRDGWRDKSLMNFSVPDIDTLSLHEDGRTWMARQAGGEGRWQVVEPANVDLDIGRLALAARVLSELRADAVADGLDPAQAGLTPPAATVTVFLVDGSSLELELGEPTTGPDGQPARFVRLTGQRQVMVLREATVQRIKQAFGRT